MARRAAKGEQTKAETVTIRLSPKLKYGLELLARKQHRTISSVVEWIVSQALEDPVEGFVKTVPSKTPYRNLMRNVWTLYKKLLLDAKGNEIELIPLLDEIWDPLEPDRLVKLAAELPNLLDFEEEKIWKLIKEEPGLWHGGDLDMPLLRATWDSFKSHAEGEPFDREHFEMVAGLGTASRKLTKAKEDLKAKKAKEIEHGA